MFRSVLVLSGWASDWRRILTLWEVLVVGGSSSAWLSVVSLGGRLQFHWHFLDEFRIVVGHHWRKGTCNCRKVVPGAAGGLPVFGSLFWLSAYPGPGLGIFLVVCCLCSCHIFVCNWSGLKQFCPGGLFELNYSSGSDRDLSMPPALLVCGDCFLKSDCSSLPFSCEVICCKFLQCPGSIL